MKKATFLEYDKPRLCAMVQDSNPDDMICTICNSLYDGAEAFGIQLENLEHQYRNEECLKRIFSFCRGLPIYITSYRGANNAGFTDEQCAELLLLGVKCGATIADIMGDMFCREEHELTMDAEAIKKQKALADKIHSLGGEVLFSSHLHGYYDEEECMRIAREQKARGADVVKIVNFSRTEEEMLENIKICAHLKSVCDHYLYLANGEYSRLERQICGSLGCCMYLAVQDYRRNSSKEQPSLASLKKIRDNMIF